MTYSEQQLTSYAPILEHLSPEEKALFKSHFGNSYITADLEGVPSYDDVLPEAGRVVWVIGSEANHVPSQMLTLASTDILLKRPKYTQFVDFNCNTTEGPTNYRFHSFINRAESSQPVRQQALSLAGKILDHNLSSWIGFYREWRNHTALSFRKSPQFKPQKNVQDSLIIAVDPKRKVFNKVIEAAMLNHAVIISANRMNSIFDICSRKYHALDASQRSIDSVREALFRTQAIVEQRVVFLDQEKRHVLLSRRINLDAPTRDKVANSEIGLKEIMIELFDKLPSWADVANNTAKAIALQGISKEALEQKAARLDVNSLKFRMKMGATGAVNDEVNENIPKTEYIHKVIQLFSEDEREVVIAYNLNTSEQFSIERIAEIAAEDFMRGSESGDYAFPEFIYESTNLSMS